MRRLIHFGEKLASTRAQLSFLDNEVTTKELSCIPKRREPKETQIECIRTNTLSTHV